MTNMPMINQYLFPILLLIIIVICGYFIIRSYFTNYDLKGNKEELNKRLRRLAIISGLISILTIVNVSCFEETIQPFVVNNDLELQIQAETTLLFWMQTWFLNEASIDFVFRGVSIILFLISIIGIIVFGKMKKDIFMIVSYIEGIVSSLIIYLDFTLFHQADILIKITPNFIGVIISIIFIVCMAIIFRNKNHMKKNL